MEKSLKFTANELLDSFNREFNQDEMNEIYKALIAYSLNLQEITPETDAKLDEVIDYYFDNDAIVSKYGKYRHHREGWWNIIW